MFISTPRALVVGLVCQGRSIHTRSLKGKLGIHANATLGGSRSELKTSIRKLNGARWNSTLAGSLQGIITVRDARKLNVEQLVETLPTTRISENSTYDVAFMFSRRLASYASQPALFLQPAISKLLSVDAGGSTTVNVLAAAVDQVPSNSTSGTIATHQESNCSEGVAFHITPSAEGRTLWRPAQTTSQEHALDRRRGGMISFSTRSGNRDSICQIPLASTIFETGQQSTLLTYRFSRTHSDNALHSSDPSSLQSAHIRLPPPSADKPKLSFQAPLERLTDLCTVRASMGNIIRQVDAPNGVDHAGRPASQDLEHAISTFFSTSGILSQPVSAHALVIPQAVARRNLTLLARFSESTLTNTQAQSEILLKALQVGARLHRVVSGGGGWGKKAGLLALNPEISFDGTSAGQPTAIESILGPSDDYALHSVAAPGDFICFFIDVESVGKITGRVVDLAVEKPAYVFGTAPSTIDDLEGESGTGEEDSVRYVAGLFGAISEDGMAFQEQEQSMYLDGQNGEVCKTRVDVPFARFSFR